MTWLKVRRLQPQQQFGHYAVQLTSDVYADDTENDN